MLSKRHSRKYRILATKKFKEGFKKKFGREPSNEEGQCFGVGFNMGYKTVRQNTQEDKSPTIPIKPIKSKQTKRKSIWDDW